MCGVSRRRGCGFGTYLGELALGLPRAGERVKVAAMKLAGDVAGDAHAGGSSAGVGHGSRDVRGPVVEGGDGGARAGDLRATGGAIGVAQTDVLDEAGERHVRWVD